MHGSARDSFAQISVANPGAILARQPRAGQTAQEPLLLRHPEGEYVFLEHAGVSAATLDIAGAESRKIAATIHDVLISAGHISPTAYASALADRLGVTLASWNATFTLPRRDKLNGSAVETSLAAQIGDRIYQVLCAEDGTPDELRRRLTNLQARGLSAALASRGRIDEAVESLMGAERLDYAVNGLARAQPEFSAAGPIWIWQVIAAAIVVGLIAGGFSVLPHATIAALSAIMALPFLCVTVLRMIALREVIASRQQRGGRPAAHITHLPPQTLPVYSILVPLFREVQALPGLVQSLQALDYPKAKLEILLVLEAVDLDMQAAVLAMQLPANFRTIIVPDQAPRTKPKALNYALQVTRGEYIVVYDAEDRPEPDQLLRALAAFRHGPPELGCVQAQLNIHNPSASWLTRQFTIEYSALFDAILPALSRLGLPVPLGGTSNHFRRDTLVATGAWDPFNVAEDADLGFRLARQGWRTAVIASTTWEEAPSRLGQWIRQRTRWLKGWMQTYLVHTRQLWRLNAELGLRGALGFHALMGALILSALVHPLFYVLLAYHALGGELLARSDTMAGMTFWLVACVNLGAGYIASILIGMLSVLQRGRGALAWSALLMPVTWLLVSLAAYRALYQLAFDPYRWEKTEHGSGLPRTTRRW